MHRAARYTTTEAAELIDSALSAVDHAQRRDLSQVELVAVMQRLRRLRDKLDVLACVVTDEVSQRQASLQVLGTPLTSLVSVDEGLDMRDAAREVFDAARVNAHDLIRDKALNGDLSRKHASAIGKGMATLPDELTEEQARQAQEVFVRHAAGGASPVRLSELGPAVLAEVAPDLLPSRDDVAAVAEARRARAVKRRFLNWGDDGDGSVWFRGSLPELEAQPLIRMVEGYVQSERRAAKDEIEGARAAGADAIEQRERRRAAAETTPEQRRADGFIRFVADHRGAPASAADRPRVVVTIRESDLRDAALTAGLLPNGHALTAGELRRIVCHADVMPVVLGGRSEVLDVGQEHRFVTPGIRKALSERDGGCVFPNCHRPDPECEAHHVIPWWAGGATAISNLVLLCPRHHKLLEPDRFGRRDQWSVRFDDHTGRPVVVPPRRVDRFMEHGRGARSDGADRGSVESGPPLPRVPERPPMRT